MLVAVRPCKLRLAVTLVLALLAALSQQTTLAQSPEPVAESASAVPIDLGQTVPILAGAVFRPHLIGSAETSGVTTATLSGSVVYSNRLGHSIFAPGGPPGLLVADDIATTASPGCTLDEMRFRVSGDPRGDGTGVGPFHVTFALYTGCPGAGGMPLFTPITYKFDDNGHYEVIYQPDPATIIAIPPNAYFGVKFSRSLAGIVAGAPATVGFSDDRFDFPGTRCDAYFGGFPGTVHASFDLEIFARDDCPPSFPAYKNSGQGGKLFSAQPVSGIFADDIRLAIPVDANNPCNLVSWEVGFKGSSTFSPGAVQAELHTSLDLDDPVTGGRIPGTKVAAIISGPSVHILRKSFSTPIPITQQDLFVVFRMQNIFNGAIRTCNESSVGSTEDVYFVHDGTTWEARSFDSGCLSAFEVSLNCAGTLPLGACCDMELTENRTCVGGSRDGQPCSRDGHCRVCVGGTRDGFDCDQSADCPDGGSCPPRNESYCIGDSVCRDLPEMNCAFPTLWREGKTCGAFCDGGARENESCASSVDCPSACVRGSNEGGPCFDNGDCAGVCQEGVNVGRACSTDAECPSVTTGAPTPCLGAGTCGPQGICRGQFCVGGVNDGLICSRAIDCPDGECGSSCMGGDNDGLPCVHSGQCPSGFCPATPFSEPCGLGTCCTRNGLQCCATERECHTEGTPCGELQEPLETPVLFKPGQSCGDGGCPIGGCTGRTGDCTQARDGICVGGTLDGEPCEFGNPCIPGLNDCCAGGNASVGVCEGSPGCGNPICCSRVCELDDRCCTSHWGLFCAAFAFNLHCESPPPPSCADAISVPVNSGIDVDLSAGAGGMIQPELCCYRREFPGGPGPGSRGEAAVWLKTIGPESGHLLVHTCFAPHGGSDSILQVYAVGDLEKGLCEDRSNCDVFLQDCFDGSKCVLNERTACASLLPVGCSDDAIFEGLMCYFGENSNPRNSKLCVEVVPGDPYYILVAAKDADALGRYRVTVSEFCIPNPPAVPNDLCPNATLLDSNHPQCNDTGNCNVPFDLSGSGDQLAPATFDCPGPSCLNTMENDVWYNWIAPATGRVSVETCARPDTPDTSLAIYNGCDCPADAAAELACSETELTTDCILGSRATTAVQGGECYKLRLGGNLGSVPSGTLKINFDPCPPGPITGIDPPSETIDARAPLDPTTGEPLGIDSFRIRWPGGTADRFCYAYCETLVDESAANLIFGPIKDHGDDTFTVNLARPVAPGAFGTLAAIHGDGRTSQVAVRSLPGDANGSLSVDMDDLSLLVGALNKPGSFNKYRHDMDHSGALTARDLLRWLDLAAGVPGAFDPWLDRSASSCHPCCPN